jgi:ribonucleotide reductase beta subunit family protein with ferritin-like domain
MYILREIDALQFRHRPGQPDRWKTLPVDRRFRELTDLPQAVELEYAYAEDTMPRGVLGLNAPMFEYLRFICNRRCQQIGPR